MSTDLGIGVMIGILDGNKETVNSDKEEWYCGNANCDYTTTTLENHKFIEVRIIKGKFNK